MALSRFCRWEGNGGALFFPSDFEREQALTVAERRFHFKAVGQVPHFSNASVFEQDFHDVEANFDGRIVYGVKIVQRGHAEKTAFLSIDRRRWARPSFVRAGFYFRKYQAVAIAQHQINFAAALGLKVARQQFHASPLQVFRRRLFPQTASHPSKGTLFPKAKAQQRSNFGKPIFHSRGRCAFTGAKLRR